MTKMSKRKRTVTTLMIFAFLGTCCILPSACMYGGIIFPRYEWERNETGVTITTVYNWRRHVVIPDTLGGYPVTQIGPTEVDRFTIVFARSQRMAISDFAPLAPRIPINYRAAGAQNIESIRLPETVTHIGVGAFRDLGNLESIYLHEGIVSIGEQAFARCISLEMVSIPSTVTFIGESAFDQCVNLREVVLPLNLTEVSNNLFTRNFSLERVVIPYGVTSIGRGAFSDAISLKEIEIPYSVTYIGPGAFGGAISLESITIPPGVTTISSGTFRNATSLREINYYPTLEYAYWNAFTGTPWLEEGGFEIMKQQLRDWGEQ